MDFRSVYVFSTHIILFFWICFSIYIYIWKFDIVSVKVVEIIKKKKF